MKGVLTASLLGKTGLPSIPDRRPINTLIKT
jgi:hypothetical protein